MDVEPDTLSDGRRWVTMLRGCFGVDAARLGLMTAVFARRTLILAFLNKLTEPTLRFIIRIEGANHEPEVLFR